MFPESSTPPSPNPQSPDTALRHPSHTHHRTFPYAALIPHETPHRTPFASAIVLPEKTSSPFQSFPCRHNPRPAKPFGWCTHVSGGRRTGTHPALAHHFCHSLYHAPDSHLISFAIVPSRA